MSERQEIEAILLDFEVNPDAEELYGEPRDFFEGLLRRMKKNFTLLELGTDADSPMVGTILGVEDTEKGIKSFKKKFLNAISEHFDVVDFNYSELPDMFVGTPYEDVEIEIEGMNYEIRILETWVY